MAKPTDVLGLNDVMDPEDAANLCLITNILILSSSKIHIFELQIFEYVPACSTMKIWMECQDEFLKHMCNNVRMAERSKAPDSRAILPEHSGPHLWAWVRIPLLTRIFCLLSIL